MRSPLDWLRVQIDVLFRTDAQGRLVASHEPDRTPPPRVFLGRTPEGNLWRTSAEIPDETRRTLEALCAAEPVTDQLEAAPRCANALREALEADAAIAAEYRGPAFHFPDDFAFDESGAERIDPDRPDSVALLHSHLPDHARDIRDIDPCLVVVRDRVAVSVAFSAAASALAAECGAETAPAYRGRGHIVTAVAAWAEATRRAGVAPLYSTQWSNAASRRVSEKLGLVVYAEDFHLR